MTPVKLIIAGAGSRGWGYSRYASLYPEQAVVVGTAEPRPFYRQRMVEANGIAPENTFNDWTEMAAREKFADAVIISMPDALHAEPAIAFAKKGYAILLEKPMAPTAEECRQVAAAAKANKVMLAVCHVLRYTAYTQKLKSIVDSGLIGEVVSVQHLEPVGYWHQGHSFVRGNWRNTRESSFMLLAKSCHDIDWLSYIIGQPCRLVSSFGSLSHFKKDHKPVEAGAAVRCLDCAYEAQCAYSACKMYQGLLRQGLFGWPLDVITNDFSEAGVTQALLEGPDGRLVYECDNDVVDHQVVNLLYANGATASFTMTAFDEGGDRRTTLFGTRGELRSDGRKITHFDFLTDKTEVIDATTPEMEASGHGGGDFGLMERFLAAVAANDPAIILSGADATLESHLTVFAAEQSRLEGRTVQVNP